MDLAALALALLASATPVLEGSLRSEARSRTPQAGDTSPVATEELQLDPALAAYFRLQGGDASLRYTPRLTLVEPGGRNELAVLHAGRAEGSYRAGERQTLRASATGSWGQTSFSPLLGTTALPADRQPRTSTLPYLSAEAIGAVEWAFTGRVRSVATLGWAASGGGTEEARRTLPLQQGPRLNARLSYLEDRLSTLSANLQASRTAFAPGPTASLALLSGLWQTRTDRQTNLELEAGAGASYAEGLPPTTAPQGVGPVAALGLHHAFLVPAQRVEGTLTARLAPAVDPLLGEIYERLDAAAALGWAPARDLTLDTRASTGLSASGSRAGEGASTLESALSYRVSQHVLLAALGRAIYFTPGDRGSGPPWGWLASVTATVVERSD